MRSLINAQFTGEPFCVTQANTPSNIQCRPEQRLLCLIKDRFTIWSWLDECPYSPAQAEESRQAGRLTNNEKGRGVPHVSTDII